LEQTAAGAETGQEQPPGPGVLPGVPSGVLKGVLPGELASRTPCCTGVLAVQVIYQSLLHATQLLINKRLERRLIMSSNALDDVSTGWREKDLAIGLHCESKATYCYTLDRKYSSRFAFRFSSGKLINVSLSTLV